MSQHDSPRDLAKYLALARAHLSEAKAKEFEAAYKRMQERADRWGVKTRQPVPPAVGIEMGTDAQKR